MSIAYIFERYPVLTQTFLRREIAGLMQHGLRVEIHSMFGPAADADASPALENVPVRYFNWWNAFKLTYALPRELLRDPGLLREGWRLCRQYHTTNRENFWATVWAVIFAVCHAPRIRAARPGVLHGVRATGPATAAAILSRLCGIPFTFGGHAYDIYRHDGDAFLEPKLRAARFVHTTTEAAASHLRQRFEGVPVNIILARRGLEQLPPDIKRAPGGHPIRLLSVGRLVAKKGHRHQIEACAVLKSRGIPFEARIIGDGPLREALQRQIEQAGLGDSITLHGAVPSPQIDEHYRWADIFWHTGVIDEAGDRDGLPNVIPEAFSHRLPVISNQLPATAEVLIHNQTGLAVDVTHPAALANAVTQLLEYPELRAQLGENGCRWVEENFLVPRNAATLARAFVDASQG